MMRQMRENTKWIMLVTAMAFVGLMVFQWGMDITGRSGLSIGEIGSVNGTPVILRGQFNQTYRSHFRSGSGFAGGSSHEPTDQRHRRRSMGRGRKPGPDPAGVATAGYRSYG